MSKRKPSEVFVHRIELQQKEREVLELGLMMDNANKLLKTMASISPETMYAWLTVAEAFGLVDTPIPTLGDYPENGILNALKSISQQRYDEIEQAKTEAGEELSWAERNLSDQALLARFFSWLDATSGTTNYAENYTAPPQD
tara:strand:+ start:183 stop:608 length:426 start_codon:yes stop_codon:yes gene_type:complete